MSKIIFNKEYDGESIVDLNRDINESFSTVYNPIVEDIPVDDNFIMQGTFKVTVEYFEPEEETTSNDVNFKQFIKDAIRTESVLEKLSTDVNFKTFITILDIFNILGSLLDKYKKCIFYNKDVELSVNEIAIIKQLMFIDKDEFFKFKNCNTSNPHIPNINPRLVHGLLGKVTESIELAEILKSYLETGEYDKVNLKEELGDSDWYDAIIIDDQGFDKQDILNTVINKLKTRYPEKFNNQEANNRDLEAERQVLENANNTST